MTLTLIQPPRSGEVKKEFFERQDRPIDLEYLQAYMMGNKRLEREVLQLFKGQSRIFFGKLSVADNSESWRNAARVLRLSAASIGARKLEIMSENAENMRFRKRDKNRMHLITLLAEQIEETNHYIDGIL